MNSARYAAYRSALQLLDEARPFALPAPEHELLRDCAEGLLLCREQSADAPECADLTGRAALALARAVMEDRWSNDAADEAWLVLRGCGPGDAEPRADRTGVVITGFPLVDAGERPRA